MPVALLLVGVFALYLLMEKQQATTVYPVVAPPPTVGVPMSGSVASGEAEAGAAVSGVSAGLNFVPIVGPAVSAVFSVIAGNLLKASAQRAAQAKTENQAVAAAIPGWDAGVAQIVAAYNNGTITGPEAISLLGTVRAGYWTEVTPQIQPSRNGCKGGTVPLTYGTNYCTGSYGAACCVGYTNLEQSLQGAQPGSTFISTGATAVWRPGLIAAVTAAEAQPGVPQSANVYGVSASKYGGADRAGYVVTFKKPVSSASPSGSLLSMFGL